MRVMYKLFTILLLGFALVFLLNCGKESTVAKKRECILDRQVHVQDSVIWEIPDTPRWCDKLELEKKRIDIGECELYVEEQGSGTPIVLLHGGPGATHHEFHPAFDRASKYARVIYYDQRGCGGFDQHPRCDPQGARPRRVRGDATHVRLSLVANTIE